MKQYILNVNNISKSFGGLKALQNITFKAEKEKITAIIGPNGAGKTTLFNVINGFYKPDKGKIFFKNHDITGLKPHKICQLGIARTFQIVKPLSKLNVLENVIASSYLRTNSYHKAEEIAKEILEFTGLIDDKDKLAKSLPLGKRKRLEIARALATQPELLLLDEAFAGLNPAELDLSIELVRNITKKGISILIIEHHMKVIMQLSDHIIVLDYGEKIAEGNPNEVAQNSLVIEAYLGESNA
jgi:branched-chain amino acid transport system ATP-binding protein